MENCTKEIMCDMVLVAVNCILFGRPWLNNFNIKHDGSGNTYSTKYDKRKVIPHQKQIDKGSGFKNFTMANWKRTPTNLVT